VFLSLSVALHLAAGFLLFGRDAAQAAMPAPAAAAQPQVVQVMLAPTVARQPLAAAQAVVQKAQPAPPKPQIKTVKPVKPVVLVKAVAVAPKPKPKPQPQPVAVRAPAPAARAPSKPAATAERVVAEQSVASQSQSKAAGHGVVTAKPAVTAIAAVETEVEVLSHQPAFRLPPEQPRYPAQARRRNHQGVVLLEVRLDARGAQREIRLLRSSGFSSLDRAALEAVAEWRFHPEVINGQGVPSRVQIPVEFALMASR
jgi:protein TonB